MANNILKTLGKVISFISYELVTLLSLLILVLTIAGQCAANAQFGDLCAQLYLGYFYFSLLLLAILLLDWTIGKRRHLAIKANLAMLGVVLLIALLKFIPLYLRVDKAPDGHNPTLLHFNLLGEYNKDKTTFFEQINQEKPDVVFVSELCGGWENDLDGKMQSQFAYCDDIDKGSFLRIYSKFPIIEKRMLVSEFDHRARLLVKISHPQIGPLSFILVHPIFPLGKPIFFEERNKEFAQYASDIKSLSTPAMIVGDLNCTPWSPHFDKILKDCHLKDSERGFGVQPSFPAPGLPLMYVPLLPIDHVLVSDKVFVKERKLLKHAGSDHFPLLVRLYVEK